MIAGQQSLQGKRRNDRGARLKRIALEEGNGLMCCFDRAAMIVLQFTCGYFHSIIGKSSVIRGECPEYFFASIGHHPGTRLGARQTEGSVGKFKCCETDDPVRLSFGITLNE